VFFLLTFIITDCIVDEKTSCDTILLIIF